MKNQKGFSLIELLIVIVIIGIIAAIAIPSLLRARVSANEGAMIGDTRSVISAGVAYESASQGNGFAPTMDCYNTPSTCLAAINYPATAPTFLDATLGAAGVVKKQGYDRSYVPSATLVGTLVPGPDGFCYQGDPTTQDRTGVRHFGGDSAGIIGTTSAAGAACCAGALPGATDTTTCPVLQ